ncbi:HTH-type transcriptional regulator DmlR [Vibrio aerogenes CECT 7868]|uniref:HTH-type transcriptional regulator DmlR n=1 Tax=Vibrio aerogenes CECT 7868 TaxID=1216006 RepID=A0A1M5ZK91_9VIBR|nr:LysR substrate-binding domain-containing protein [Vibrio aerogenes]SHI24549.1 HTH-type transcriptional regulator DmlR [Vibrio aerogenes CECT 7868]
MSHYPNPDDIKVFVLAAKTGGFSAAAQRLNASPAYVSKRVAMLERTLGIRLFHRGARHVALTTQGKVALEWAEKLLDVSEQMMQALKNEQMVPTGTLRIVTSTGFGSHCVAPLLSGLPQQYPELEIDLELLDRPVDLISEGFDLEIRTGPVMPSDLIAKKIYTNHRILCASPGYLEAAGHPQTLKDLKQHRCILIREREQAGEQWQLFQKKMVQDQQAVETKVTFAMKTNYGEVAKRWCLDGAGIMLRSVWSVREALEAGALVQVLPEYTQPADFWAIYPDRLSASAKLRVVVDYLSQQLGE